MLQHARSLSFSSSLCQLVPWSISNQTLKRRNWANKTTKPKSPRYSPRPPKTIHLRFPFFMCPTGWWAKWQRCRRSLRGEEQCIKLFSAPLAFTFISRSTVSIKSKGSDQASRGVLDLLSGETIWIMIYEDSKETWKNRK